MTDAELAQLFNQACARHGAGDMHGAAALYRKVLKFRPDNVATLANFGNLLYAQGKFADALVQYDKALAVAPREVDLWLNRGYALRELQQRDAALATFETAASLAPDAAPAWTARGGILQGLRRLREALDSYGRALALEPRDLEALNNSGVVLTQLGDHGGAVRVLDAALRLSPDNWQARTNRATALREAGQIEVALADYAAAITANPNYAEAFYNRGDLLMGLRRYEEACGDYSRAFHLAPALPNLEGALLNARMQLCDWPDFETHRRTLLDKVDCGLPATPPFPLLQIPCTARQQRQAAEIHAAHNFAAASHVQDGPREPGRIRIAYVSANFRRHPVMQLAIAHFEGHDRERFETFAVSMAPGDGSAMRARLQQAFDHFLDCATLDDLTTAQRLRDLGINIAIDLDGHTQGGRPGVFLARAAPLQLGWLGYPGTMGSAHLDYIVADDVVVPPGAEAGYSERILRLPHCYQPNSPRPETMAASRAEAGLPPDGIIFCAFNNPAKITPAIFAAWIRIVAAVPHSLLWLRVDDDTARSNLIHAAGDNAQRLVFAPHAVDDADHFARLAAADIFLDTAPYNAHTTASDALWAGVPVVTIAGDTFAGRVAASIVTVAGMPELACDTLDDYEALAIRLATNPQDLLNLKRKVRESRMSSLFDIKRFTRDFEATLLPLV